MVAKYINVSRYFPSLYNNFTITTYTMYLNKFTGIIILSSGLCLAIVKFVQHNTTSVIINPIINIVYVQRHSNFIVDVSLMDCKFEPLHSDLLDKYFWLNTTSTENCVPEI